MTLRDIDPYFPDRPPTWSEVLTSVLVAGALLPNMIVGIASIPTVVVGFLLTTLSLATKRVEEWLHRLGTSGRGILVLSVFLTTLLIALLAPDLYTLLNDAGTGILLATTIYFAVFLARERTVSGWRATPNTSE